MDEIRRRGMLRMLGISSIATLATRDAPAQTSTTALADVRAKVGRWVSARDFGVKADGESDDTAALQAAIDYVRSRPGAGPLILPTGEIRLRSDLRVRSSRAERPDRQQIIVEGSGSGVDGTWLHFASGSLVVASPNHVLRDFRVTSDKGDGIVIKPDGTSSDFPSRGIMENVRAEYCARAGITIEDTWLYILISCYARFNRFAGLEGRRGARIGIACNALTIVGGEFQGNGANMAPARGTGAGIITGRCVQFSMTGGAVEGNLGDGIVLSEQLRGFALNSVYFEKNGTHASNRDLTTDHFDRRTDHAANAPNSGWLLNCNFTPQDAGGNAQERAIDLVNVRDLRIVNPQFYAQSKPVLYSREPIRLRETTPGRCTGWVEGGYFSSVRYTQDMVRNETARYGFPRIHRYSPDLHSNRTVGLSPVFCIPLTNDAATRVDITVLSRANTDNVNAQINCGARFGPRAGNWSLRSETLQYSSGGVPTTFRRRVGRSLEAAAPGHVEVQIGLSSDRDSTQVRLLSVEIVSYEARVA